MLKQRFRATLAAGSWLEWLLVVLILGLAAYLRLTQRADNPAWHSDEGTLLNIAQNFARGRVQYLALNQSILIAARLPLFPVLTALLFPIAGEGMATLRLLSGALGVLSVGLVCASVRPMGGARLALLAALLFAVYPNAVLYSRLGFSYNLLTPLALLTYLALWRYLSHRRRRWLALAALSIGVGVISDVMMLTFALPFVIVVLARRWRDLLWSMPLMAAPLGLYAAYMLATAPQAFLFDVNYILNALGTIPIGLQPFSVLVNYATLLFKDSWAILGIIGLFLLRVERMQRLTLLMFWLPLLAISRSTAGLADLSYRYMIPLLPFVAIGVAALLEVAAPRLVHIFADDLTALVGRWGWRLPRSLLTFGNSLVLFGVIVSPFLISTFLMVREIQTGFHSTLDAILIDPGEARAVSDFINRQTGPSDLVVGSPTTLWQFQTQVSDFQIALAAEGRHTVSLPASIPADRFAYDSRYTHAKFVVIDRLWRNWAAPNMPEVAAMMQNVQSWPLVFQAGEIDVYQNPAL